MKYKTFRKIWLGATILLTGAMVVYVGLAVRSIWFTPEGMDQGLNRLMMIWIPLMLLGMVMCFWEVAVAARKGRERANELERRMAQKHVLYCVVSEEALAKMVTKRRAKGQRESQEIFVRGKFGAQCGHAFLHAWWDAMDRNLSGAMAYKNSKSAFKIVLVTPTDADLQVLHDAYRDKVGVSLVRDAGHTVFAEPTITCLGIGPIREELIGQDLKDLKLLT